VNRILIVEDTPSQAHVLRRQIDEADREIESARSVAEAIEKLAGTEFDLVIADLRIKGLPDNKQAGLDVLRAVKQLRESIQVIIVTNYATPELSEEAMKLGAFDVLDRNPSPVGFSGMLRAKIRLALEHRRLMQLIERQQ
jgi:DNA-binding NtrC family response regulator